MRSGIWKPPKSLFRPPDSAQNAGTQETAAPKLTFFLRLTPLERLLWVWGAGAVAIALLFLGSYIREAILLPPRLNEMAAEIYSAGGTNELATMSFARRSEPVERTGTNESGSTFSCYFVPPARVSPAKKYPALVDMTSSLGKGHGRDIQFLANAGIFYVSPNSLAISNWGVVPEPQNTRAVYAALLKQPNVDPKRIYICGQSITTVTACAMVDENPERWRGVILLEPVRYPKIPDDARRFPSVFISQGLADRYNEGGGIGPGKAERFLLEACRSFIPARMNYQPGGHGYPDAQLKAAYKAVIRFILTDY